MYYLYLDESGHVGNYYDKNLNKVKLTSKYFTTAGIVVKDDERSNFEQAIKDIISKYFKGITLPPKFKLQYNPLIQGKKDPYDKLKKRDRVGIADQIFDAINGLPCLLLHVNIDLDKHYYQYSSPIPHRTLTLKYIVERFELIVSSYSDTGVVIYEKFSNRESKKIQTSYGRLFEQYGLPDWVEIKNVNPIIQFKTVQQEPILQFSDFIAYASWKRVDSGGAKQARWDSIKTKYWNLRNPDAKYRGNITV